MSILSSPRLCLRGAHAATLIVLFCSAANVLLAQSLDIRSPAPIRTSEVVGTIAARDLGDSRLTDHYYVFTGAPGDVLITVKGNNLNGDVDLFTAGSLRPLMKFALYAESSTPATRSIFLRKREDLILRVEARSPNDDQGTYHISLGGAFEPVAGEDSATAESASTVASRGKGSRRVSSVGARIAEPPETKEEIASTPIPQPTPEAGAVSTPDPNVATEAPPTARAPRRGRGRVPAVRRRPAVPPVKKNEPSGSETASEEKANEVTRTENPAPATRRTGRRSVINPPAEQIPVPEPQTGPRLVIQMNDGTLIERYMNTIKRVTVENNQIVVVRKDGRIERTRMSEVLRMAIEP